MRNYLTAIFLAALFASRLPVAVAQSVNGTTYDIGSPTLTYLWVDPINGSDNRSGASRALALKTVTAAWGKIPTAQTLTTGYQINLVKGTYPRSILPNYWESRWGTAIHPIILSSVDGDREVVFKGDINAFDLRYFYVLGVSIAPAPAGDAFHCELCNHVLLRNLELDGGGNSGNSRGAGAGAHDLLKINQSQYIYVEGCDIHGADDNPLDFVSVQYGHIARSRIHDGVDWCAYVKGGSAYFQVEGNRFYDCGTGGFTAGQGTGFEFMTSPWLHYEAYDVKVLNNLVYDVDGSGVGVNGGYNILIAHNTLYKVGQRSHALEVVYGARSCDGDSTACASRVSAGGWGTSVVGIEGDPIPNKNVFVFNNLIYNPAPYQSQYQQLAIHGPRTANVGTNISSPATTDTNLSIKGNVFWNGPISHPLGIEDNSEGCQSGNATCNETQLRAENAFNSVEPSLQDPASGDFRPSAGGNVLSATTYTIPSFAGGDREAVPQAAEGVLTNLVSKDRADEVRFSPSVVGAYATASSSLDAPSFSEPGGTTEDASPRVSRASCTPKKQKRNGRITCSVTATDDVGVASVIAAFSSGSRLMLKKSRAIYLGKYTIPKKFKRQKLTISVTATDSAGQTTQKSAGSVTIR